MKLIQTIINLVRRRKPSTDRPTKLSEALEYCINNQYYSYYTSPYMCHALRNANLNEHIPAVMDMVKSIDPTSHALAGALDIDTSKYSRVELFGVCKAHYIKWIAELKKAGK